MLHRTWPYGTRKPCEVVDVIREPRITALVCVDPAEPKEAYLCLFRPEQVTAEKGDKGTITFTKGGPTGGYWKFSPAPKVEVSA